MIVQVTISLYNNFACLFFWGHITTNVNICDCPIFLPNSAFIVMFFPPVTFLTYKQFSEESCHSKWYTFNEARWFSTNWPVLWGLVLENLRCWGLDLVTVYENIFPWLLRYHPTPILGTYQLEYIWQIFIQTNNSQNVLISLWIE